MSLLDRLAHARVLERSRPLASVRPPSSAPVGVAPGNAAFERRERFIELSPDIAVGRARGFAPARAGERASLLGGCLERLTLPGVAALARDLVCLGAREGGRAVFLDLETTGLGGACVPYVVGIATIENWGDGSRLNCTQWTLARCSGEAELLADVLARLEAYGPAPLVTFNGSSFDVPLLRVRAHRHGLSARVLDAEHVDLLHPARRLHRGRGRDCKLSTLEAELLGVRRRGDIDSAQIPEVFWDWVQSPQDVRAQRRLRAVCDHNLVDLATLPALAAWLAQAVREPGDLDRALRAARHLDRLGAGEQARLVLSRWIAADDATTRRASARWREAALELASFERRAGERERAAELLRAAWLADPGCPEASEAWAKVLEHQLGDFAQALRVARGSRQPCERRIARLEARLARAGETASKVTVEAASIAATEPTAEAVPIPATELTAEAASIPATERTTVVASVSASMSASEPGQEPRPVAAPSRMPKPAQQVASVEQASVIQPAASARQASRPHESRPQRAAELLARVDQTDSGAVVRYRLLR